MRARDLPELKQETDNYIFHGVVAYPRESDAEFCAMVSFRQRAYLKMGATIGDATLAAIHWSDKPHRRNALP